MKFGHRSKQANLAETLSTITSYTSHSPGERAYKFLQADSERDTQAAQRASVTLRLATHHNRDKTAFDEMAVNALQNTGFSGLIKYLKFLKLGKQ